MNDAAGLIRVSVSRRPAIWFCVDPEAGDDEASWMLEYGWIDSPEVALLLDALPPSARVLDAGCGVGVFALAAAAAGAEVVAIDSAPANVELVQAAARRNGFERLRVLCASSVEGLDVDRADAVRLRHATPQEARAAFGRPAVVFDGELRGEADRLGREVLMIDELRGKVLVRTAADDLWPHAACHCTMLDEVPSGWRVEPALGDDQILSRLIDEAGSPSPTHRAHAARLLAACTQPAAAATQSALAIDVEPQVRAYVGNATSKPAPGPRPSIGETVVLAASLSLPEVLSDAHFHVRAGQYVGVLAAPDEMGGSALLKAIAGLLDPSGGTLEVLTTPTLVSGLADAVQPGLSVAQNLELLGAFVGADVAEVDRRISELARGGGFAEALPLRLAEAGGDVAQRLVLCAALHLAPGSLILLDGLPAIDGPQLRHNIGRRVRELLREGISIIQCVREPREMIARPDRLMWISGARIVHNGHAESLTQASEHRLAGAPG
jgi:ABC-type polysaccharide/polyol phosphate transport system ATPase subunit/SAM-dependent methyltransferase